MSKAAAAVVLLLMVTGYAYGVAAQTNSPTYTPPPSCPSGQHLEGNSCVPDQTYTPPPTTSSSYTPPASCPSGQHFENGNCVPDQTYTPPPTTSTSQSYTYTSPSSCPSGQHYENGNCAPNTTYPTCSAGQYWDTGSQQCKSNPTQGSCPPDQYWDWGAQQCRTSGGGSYSPPPSCPQGQYWDHGSQSCRQSSNQGTPGTCGPDQYWDYGSNSCRSNQGGPQPTGSPQQCPPDHFWDGYRCAYQAPPCPPDHYFDYGTRQCKPQGQFQQQPTCAPPQYYDHYRQACESPPPSCGPDEFYNHDERRCVRHDERPDEGYYGDYPRSGDGGQYGPPPGCSSEGGYCPPPPQSSCAPEDQYCRPPPSQNCGRQMDGVRFELESLFRSFGDEMFEFQQQFEDARRAMEKEARSGGQRMSPDEWRSFGEEWRKKGEAKAQEFMDKYSSFIASKNLGECAQYLPPPPMGGGFGGPPPGGPQGPPEHYMHEPPPADEARYYHENEAVRKIRMECEDRVRELHSSESGEGGPGDNPEKREAMKQILRECEKRIRAQFEEAYDEDAEEGEDDFDDDWGSFTVVFDEDAREVSVSGKFTSLRAQEDSQIISEVSCGGSEVLEELFVEGYLEEFGVEEKGKEGSALQIEASGQVIAEIHDNPRCTINLATSRTIPKITLNFADHWDLEQEDENKDLKFSDEELSGKILVHKGKLVPSDEDDTTYVLKGKATLLVSKSHASKKVDAEVFKSSDFQEALEDGQIGAEVKIGVDDEAEEEGDLKVAATSYGDLEVAVEKQAGSDVVEATVSSENHEGKTIVMAFANDIFDTVELEVKAWDVTEESESEEDEDQDESGDEDESDEEAEEAPEEEELCSREADDLQDVLDPTDDDDCVEYWAVQDKNGVQTLVSIPGFSTKRLEIQSVASSAVGPIPGFEVVFLGVALTVAIAIVAVRTRRDD